MKNRSFKKQNLFFLLTIIAIISLFSNISFANGEKNKKEKVLKLKEIVVTATRTESTLKDIPASITVISREDIKRSPAQTVDQLLALEVGIDVRRPRGLTEGAPSVTMRGVGGSRAAQGRILVLVDGVPINNLYSGEPNWNSIPLEDVERIEIIRGAYSSLYGSNAMGGVINIITRKPKKTFEGSLDLNYGNMNTYFPRLSMGGKKGAVNYFLTAHFLHTDGYKAVPVSKRKPYDIKREAEEQCYTGKISWFPTINNEISLFLSHFYDYRNFGRKYYYQNNENNHINLTYRHDEKRFIVKAGAYFHDDESKYHYDKSPDYDSVKYVSNIPKQDWGGTLQGSIFVTNWNSLTLGVDYRQGKVDAKDNYRISSRIVECKGKQETIALFVHDEIKLFENKFIMNLGCRFDWVKNFDGYSYDSDSPPEIRYKDNEWSAISPRVALLYHANDKISLYGSFGKSFRAPTLYDLYRTWTYGSTTYASNPELDPETVISYEIGAKYNLKNKFVTSLSYYWMDAEDFIYSVTVDSDLKKKQNIAKVRMQGIELVQKYRISSRWSCFGNLTYSLSEIKDYPANKELEGNSLAYMPKLKYGVGLSFDDPKLFSFYITGRYIDEVYTNDTNTKKLKQYFVVDFKAKKALGKYITLYVEGLNLFDKRYKQTKDYEAPGIEIRGGIIGKF
ncbi:MAG: TonB-dependent receptor [Deltaproteobacteria bacterium]|nr:TonB-dependent receptor [Deltaproteobacteria bacterium]